MFALFVFGLVYNSIRGLMLWKAKRLELREHASGLPALFSLDPRGSWSWGTWYTIAYWGFFMNIVVVLVHSGRFLMLQVPKEM